MTSQPAHHRSTSLRFKLTAWYLTTLAIVLSIIGAAASLYIRSDQIRDADTSLANIARETVVRLADTQGTVILKPQDRNARLAAKLGEIDHFGQLSSESGLFVRLSEGSTSETLFASKGLKHSMWAYQLGSIPTPAGGAPVMQFVGVPGESRLRLVSARVGSTGTVFQAAMPWDRQEAQLRDTEVRIGVLIVGFLVLSGFATQSLISRALFPVSQIVSNAERLSADRFSDQLLPPVEIPDREIRDLVDSLNRMMARLHDSFRRQQQFAADAAHELRTPLTIMQGEMDVVLRRERTPERYRQVIESGLEETKRLAGIVDDLGCLARGEIDSAASDTTVDLTAVTDQVVGLMEPTASTKGIAVTLRSPDHGVFVKGDVGPLTRVVTNLLANAINYSPNGAGEITVSVSRCGSDASLTVTDHGVGIDAVDLPHIFERFYRADKGRRNDGGHGLGLSIVKAVVESYGGRVAVTSTLGTGSQFEVALPLATTGSETTMTPTNYNAPSAVNAVGAK
ncbi:MAG TPA: ATP-binding protein [Capsulimonadaceae bacterium]|jgi:heavy metal sensor kinase